MTRSQDREPDGIEGEKARQGQIVLRRTWQRVVFVAGLIGLVAMAAALLS